MNLSKIISALIYFFCAANVSFSQNKTFYNEDFSSGKLPAGWYIPEVGDWDPQWIVTNQPYPGSYQYQQQAPPIASPKSYQRFRLRLTLKDGIVSSLNGDRYQ